MAPVDEYDRYAFELVSLLERGCSLDDLYRRLVRLREDVFGMGPGARDDLLFAGRLLSHLRPRDVVLYVIEDEWHGEHCGDFESFDAAVSELKRRAKLPWDTEPNVAPCQDWRTCGRSYAIVEYDPRSESGRVLSRTQMFEMDSKGVRWLSASDAGGTHGGPGREH